VAVTIFGGFAPFFAQSLVDLTGSNLAPSYYIMATALLSLVSLLILQGRIDLSRPQSENSDESCVF
jgi:MHS family proline/betaine transporter-like MFS transporter